MSGSAMRSFRVPKDGRKTIQKRIELLSEGLPTAAELLAITQLPRKHGMVFSLSMKISVFIVDLLTIYRLNINSQFVVVVRIFLRIYSRPAVGVTL